MTETIVTNSARTVWHLYRRPGILGRLVAKVTGR